VDGRNGVQLDHEGRIATLSLRAEPPGLLGGQLVSEISEAIETLAGDDRLSVLIVRSLTPGFFACHFDVGEILEFDKSAESANRLKPYHVLCEQIRTMPIISIAVLEGRVGGGGAEIALSCDMRVAAKDSAVFCQPEVALGLIPGGSGTVRIPRLIGSARAMELILGCDDLDAETAAAWGLVNRTLAADRVWPFTQRLASRIASFPPHAVSLAKRAVLAADVGVTEQLLWEAGLFREALADPLAQQRMRQFLAARGQSVENEERLGDFLGSFGAEGDD